MISIRDVIRQPARCHIRLPDATLRPRPAVTDVISIHDAIRIIRKQIVKHGVTLVSVEAALTEDGAHVLLEAHVDPDEATGGLPLVAGFDLPAGTTDAAFEEEREHLEIAAAAALCLLAELDRGG